MYKARVKACLQQQMERLGYEIIEDLDAKEEKFDVKEITVEIDGKEVVAQLKREWLEDKTVDELRNIARELELTGYYNLKKNELIAEIEKVE